MIQNYKSHLSRNCLLFIWGVSKNLYNLKKKKVTKIPLATELLLMGCVLICSVLYDIKALFSEKKVNEAELKTEKGTLLVSEEHSALLKSLSTWHQSF